MSAAGITVEVSSWSVGQRVRAITRKVSWLDNRVYCRVGDMLLVEGFNPGRPFPVIVSNGGGVILGVSFDEIEPVPDATATPA
jgi:hypothetical protein